MKVLELVGKEKLRFTEVPEPQIGDDEVLLKIKKVGICGTDLHVYQGGMKIPLPLVMGHEFVGDVIRVGQNVTNVKVGDIATAEHVIGCGQCRYCVYGKKNLCLSPAVIGLHRPGALAEYMAIPADLVYPLPGSLTYDDGVLVEPLSIAVYGVRKAGIAIGDMVAIVGQGPIGLFLDQVAKAAGAQVYGFDVLPSRLDYALRHHIVDGTVNTKLENTRESFERQTGGIDTDVVFEVVGQESTARLALDLVRPGGKVVILGVFEHDVKVSMMNIVKREVHVMGSWTCLNVFEPTINLLESKRIITKDIITHRYDFAKAPQAFIEASSYNDNRIKSVIEFG